MIRPTRTPSFDAAATVPEGVAVLGVPVFTDLTSPPGCGAEINVDFLRQRRFDGKPGQAQALLADDLGRPSSPSGWGDRGSVDADSLRRAGATLARHAGSAVHVATTLPSASEDPELVSAVVEGIGLGAYRYAGAPKRTDANGRFERVTIVESAGCALWPGARFRWTPLAWPGTGVNPPPRDLTPAEFAPGRGRGRPGSRCVGGRLG